MLDLGDLTIFAKVVETESLTKTGAALGLPKSTVSRRLSRLEAHLGVQLLHRSTRSVTVTSEGAVFFEYCLRSIGVLRDGQRALQSQHSLPQGIVRIAMPHVLGQSLIGRLIVEFLDQHPDVRIVTVLTDDTISFLRNGFDVALAIGPLEDSGLIATRLGTTSTGLFGAPEYFERKGMPQQYQELPRFDLLANGSVDRRYKWEMRRKDEEVVVEFLPKLVCNDLVTQRDMAVQGLGIACLPAFLCKHELANGRLVEVLPDWQWPDMNFFALFSDPKGVPVRVRSLIDFLVKRLRVNLSWDID